MPYRLYLRNVAHQGHSFRVNGKQKLDRYVFQRDPDPRKHSEHIIIVPDAEWPAVRDDIYFEGQSAVIFVDYILDPKLANQAIVGPLMESIEQLTTQLLSEQFRSKTLTEELDKARIATTEAGSTAGGLTDEQREFLRERDALCDLLEPMALEGDTTPAQVLARILSAPIAKTEETEKAKPEPVADPEKPVRLSAQALQKLSKAKLVALAGSIGIEGAHTIQATTLIHKIVDRYAVLDAESAAKGAEEPAA